MANIFLDTNCVSDLIQGDSTNLTHVLESHKLSLSVLSVHIMVYVLKIPVPNDYLSQFLEHFSQTDLTATILSHSLEGPTADLEDNIQLWSALAENCHIFLTRDKKLLQLNTFQQLSILSPDAL